MPTAIHHRARRPQLEDCTLILAIAVARQVV